MTPSFHILTRCQGTRQLGVGSRTLSPREGKAGAASFAERGGNAAS